MKKIFLGLVLLFGMINIAQARFFLGVDGSFNKEKITMHVGEKETKINPNGVSFDVNLGTEHYFGESEYVGLRWFLSGGYGKIFNTVSYSNFNVSFGMDLLVDVWKFNEDYSIGLFGGAQVNAIGLTTPLSSIVPFNRNLVNLHARAGLTIKLAKHNRIEFAALIPVWDIVSVNQLPYEYSSLRFQLGYKLVF